MCNIKRHPDGRGECRGPSRLAAGTSRVARAEEPPRASSWPGQASALQRPLFPPAGPTSSLGRLRAAGSTGRKGALQHRSRGTGPCHGSPPRRPAPVQPRQRRTPGRGPAWQQPTPRRPPAARRTLTPAPRRTSARPFPALTAWGGEGAGTRPAPPGGREDARQRAGGAAARGRRTLQGQDGTQYRPAGGETRARVKPGDVGQGRRWEAGAPGPGGPGLRLRPQGAGEAAHRGPAVGNACRPFPWERLASLPKQLQLSRLQRAHREVDGKAREGQGFGPKDEAEIRRSKRLKHTLPLLLNKCDFPQNSSGSFLETLFIPPLFLLSILAHSAWCSVSVSDVHPAQVTAWQHDGGSRRRNTDAPLSFQKAALAGTAQAVLVWV